MIEWSSLMLERQEYTPDIPTSGGVELWRFEIVE
jgi:hypothetical protein